MDSKIKITTLDKYTDRNDDNIAKCTNCSSIIKDKSPFFVGNEFDDGYYDVILCDKCLEKVWLEWKKLKRKLRCLR